MSYIVGGPEERTPAFAVVLVRHEYEPDVVLSVSRRGLPYDLGLPGGKIEPGEKPEAAARRELMEETGIYAVMLDYVFDREEASANNQLARVYEAVMTLGEAKTIEEGCIVKWVHRSCLLQPHCSFRDYNRQLFEYLDLRDGV